MSVGREGLGEEVGKVLCRLDFLNFNLPACYQFLSEGENLRVDVLGAITLDESSSYLHHTCYIILKEDGRLGRQA